MIGVLVVSAFLWVVLQVAANGMLIKQMEPKFCEQGICIRNRSIFPVSRLRLKLEIRNRTIGTVAFDTLYGYANARDEQLILWEMKDKTAGFYEITIQRLTLYDLFSATRISRKMNVQKNRVIMPEIRNGIEERYERALSERLEEERRGEKSDYGEMLSIRDYVPGDSLHQIHFKLSAKYDKLCVREFETGEEYENVLIYETMDYPDSNREESEMQGERLERLTDFFSLCIYLIQRGQTCRLMWYDGNEGRMESHRVTIMDELLEIILLLMKCERTISHRTTAQMIEEFL